MVINIIDLDLSDIPAPVCTCTGRPRLCYRRGFGGRQSAWCTTTASAYLFPPSTKRQCARIAGRKMSQGAFKKVLEKLAREGQDFSSQIDLKLLMLQACYHSSQATTILSCQPSNTSAYTTKLIWRRAPLLYLFWPDGSENQTSIKLYGNLRSN